jgi:hypothetical protein
MNLRTIERSPQTVCKPREDEVEYELLHSFEYSEKYELKSGSKSVKGRFSFGRILFELIPFMA